MEDPIEQPKTNDAATESKLPDPATSIRCKHCNHSFAAISVEGGLIPSIPQEQACTSCEPFLGFYETLQTREQEHTALLDRGPKHHGRALAHDKYRNARVALENFLINIEAPDDATFEVAQAGFANRADPVQLECKDDLVEVPKQGDNQQTLDGVSPPAEHILSTEASSTIKRKLARSSGASNLERKRIKFTETMEERAQYRGTLEFHRSAKEYVPGRYVAAEGSEFLDTSGSTLTFAKFTGQKKVGSTFVDVVPKEEAQEDEYGPSAARKKGKSRGKNKQGWIEEPHHEAEIDESQMNNRELRVSRRSRSTTPPATTRPRTKIAQYDGQDDEPSKDSGEAPSLIVTLRAPLLTNTGAFTKEKRPVQASEHGIGCQWPSVRFDPDETSKEVADAANINKIVLSIQHELSHLQQATISSRYRGVVLTAVRGFFEFLEPLKALNHIKSNQAEGAREMQEEDSIYFEAFDATDREASTDMPLQAEASKQGEIAPKWTQATTHDEEVRKVDVSRALGADALDDKPKGDKQNTSGISELEEVENDLDVETGLPMPSIEAAIARTPTQAKTKYISKARPRTAEPRKRSRTRIPTTPLNRQRPSYNDEETSVRPRVKFHRMAQIALSQKSRDLSLTAALDSGRSKEWDHSMDNNNEDRTKEVSISKHSNHIKVPGVPKIKAKNAILISHKPPLTNNAFGVASVPRTSSHKNGSTQLEPGFSVWPTLEASPVEPSRIEAARSVNQRFGELVNSRDERQGFHAQSESEALKEAPQTSNINQDLSTAPAGPDEASGQSELHITDTDRRGAGQEAQVDPDTAHDSVQVEISEDRYLSADRRDWNNIETLSERMPDAVEPSCRSPQ